MIRSNVLLFMLHRALFLFVLLLAFSASLRSQCGKYWEWQNPWPQGHIIYDVQALHHDTMIGVGAFGTIVRSLDGGSTWDVRSCVEGDEVSLMAVHFPDDQEGWAVGYNGTVLHTNDGGANWVFQGDGLEGALQDVHFLNEDLGWTVGTEGTLLRTRNGGNDWEVQGDTISQDLNGLHFIDDSTGWVVGSGGNIYTTRDSGKTWDLDTTGISAFGEAVKLNNVYFQDDSTGWVVGRSGKLLYTGDQGDTWEERNSGVTFPLYDIDFKSSDTGSIVGWVTGKVVYTESGGASWKEKYAGSSLNDHMMLKLWGLDYSKDGTGWIAGKWGGIMRKEESDTSWSPVSTDQDHVKDIHSLSFIDHKRGWAVGFGGRLYHTQDMGENWNVQVPSIGGNVLHAVQFLNEDRGWVVGETNQFHYSEDGGTSWSPQMAQEDLLDLHFLDSTSGWAVGRWGAIHEIDDGVWKDHSWGGSSLQAVHFVEPDHGWVLRRNYGPSRTTDGGQSWEGQGPEVADYMDLYFVDKQYGWVIGEEGLVYHTSDGGDNWEKQEVWTNEDLNEVFFLDRNTGWIAADQGILLRTDDGGEHWHRLFTGTYNDLESVYFVNPDTGWVAGGQGAILHTTEGGGYTDLEAHEVEDDPAFELHPNPASERVKVRFEARRSGEARFRILNAQGKALLEERSEVRTGMNEKLLELQGLAPGIYLLELHYPEGRERERKVSKLVLE